MSIKTSLIIFLLLFSFNVSAQEKEDFRSGAVKTNCGYLLVRNETGNYYTLDIKGADVRQTSTTHVQFSVDGIFLQIVTPEIKNFVKDKEKVDAKAILEAHRGWEANFLERQYKEKLVIQSFPQKLANGEEALVWQIDVPKSAKSNVLKQTYLAIVKGEHVLMLGSIVTDTISESASHKLLHLTALTLIVRDKPTNLAIIQALLRDKQ